jgi:hypothetical protein
MILIDDVLDNLQELCEQQGNAELKKQVEAARRIYFSELQKTYASRTSEKFISPERAPEAARLRPALIRCDDPYVRSKS